jgi:hypothetical protein
VSWFGFTGVTALFGALAAVPYFVALTGSPGAMILAFLIQLPLFAAGLWLGTGAAASAGVAAALILFFGGNLVAATAFIAVNAIPVLVLVRQSLLMRTAPEGAVEWYPPGSLTGWLTGFGLAATAAALLLFGGPRDTLEILRHALAPSLDSRFAENAVELEGLLSYLAFILPGIIGGSWMVMAATNGSLAQGVLARFGANWRPSPDLAALDLPMWIPMLFAVSAAVTFLGGSSRFFGVNVMIVLAVPFCLAGLAVLHAVARRFSRPALPLAIFYVLAGVFGWPLLLIVVLGMLESPLGLRRRFAQP